MFLPTYLEDYKVETNQGYIDYSAVGLLPNKKKEFTWKFVCCMVLEKCTNPIHIKYSFKEINFEKEISFKEEIFGRIRFGSNIYNAIDIMSYIYNKELLEIEFIISFPIDELIHVEEISWNIFIHNYTDDKSIDFS